MWNPLYQYLFTIDESQAVIILATRAVVVLPVIVIKLKEIREKVVTGAKKQCK